MSLKLYRIDSTLFHPYNGAMIKDISVHKELFSFFRMNCGDKEKIKNIEMEFVAQKGYTLENIAKTDYIFTFSAHLFSKKFVESVGDILKNEIKFFPCKVTCKGIALDWYAAQIIHSFPIIDKELSTYRELTDSELILSDAKYRTDINEQFFIARDSESITYIAVSDLFKTLCVENGLMIGFNQP